MRKLEQLVLRLNRTDRLLGRLYKKNRKINYDIERVQKERLALLKKIDSAKKALE